MNKHLNPRTDPGHQKVVNGTNPPTPDPAFVLNTGQGDGCTTKQWSSHAIAKAFDQYYDPSYGIGKFDTADDYEAAAISGFRYTDENHVDHFEQSDGFSRINYPP